MELPLASVALLLLLCMTAEAVCPQGCSCNSHHNVKCENKSLTAVPANIPDDTEVLDFSGSSIRDLLGLANQHLPKLSELTLARNQLTNIPDRSFVNFVSLRELGLPDNRISTLNSDSFAGLGNLTTLDLKNNLLNTLPTNVLEGLTSLRVLDLTNNQISSFGNLVAAGSTSPLFALPLSHNNIAVLDRRMFQGLSNLKRLILDYNKINSVDTNTFVDLSSLQKLLLDNNIVTELKNGAFNGLDSLESLLLQKNRIGLIEEDVFSKASVPKLTELQLDNNDIAMLPSIDLPSLQSLRLSNNALTSLPILNLPSLATLSITATNITTLSKNAMQYLVSLEYFYADSSPLNTIEVDALKSLGSLIGFHVVGCKLNALLPGMFSSQVKLEHLDLRSNLITELEDGTFEGLSSLKTLNMYDNLLTRVGDGAFGTFGQYGKKITDLNLMFNHLTSFPTAVRHLTALNYLRLEHNRFAHVPAGVFDNLSHLHYLYLNRSQHLQTVDKKAFVGLKGLRNVYLQSSNIKQLPGEIFQNMTSLSEINMADNPFHCDCSMEGLREWVSGKSLFKDKIICASPEMMRGRPLDTVYPDQLEKICQSASLYDASVVVASFFGGFLLAVVAYVVVVVARRRRIGRKKPRSGDFGKLEEDDMS